MFLKSLEIFGFKSFAERTRIDFSEGISALLGPNGCGKSNVVDAIKWVVGEQSARSLRAESMEDIIFSGTESRKALSVAEVTLTISNERGVLELDAPEIAVKRRLYRSGESEYFINNQPSRLKELRELFWDTGIGKSAYSVMEQGRIDQILSSKPEERRYLFEEAAGITRHKARSREAELKLERTMENMRQVEGILGEVKRSHDTLKTQSEKTLKYRAFREEIFNAELDQNLLRLRNNINDRQKRETELEEKTKVRDALKESIDRINLSMEENLDIVNDMEAKLVDIQKTIHGLAVEKIGKEKEKSLLQERAQETRAKIDQARIKLKAINEKLEELHEDEAEKVDTLRGYRNRTGELEKNIKGFEESIQLSARTIDDNENAIVNAETEIANFESELLTAQKDLDSITEDIVRELDARLRESGYSASERKKTEDEITVLIKEIIARLSGREAILDDMVRIRDYNSDEAKAILGKTKDAFSETAESARNLLELYQGYIKNSPAFIDEFLAPEGIITQKRGLDRKMQSLKDGIASRRALITEKREENRELGVKIDGYRATLEELRGNQIRLLTQIQATEETISLVRREIASQEAFRRELEMDISLDEKRLDSANESIEEIDEEVRDIEKKGYKLTSELELLEKDIEIKNSDMGKRQEELRTKTEALGKAHIELERIHMGVSQYEHDAKSLRENFREAHGRDLSEFEERMYEVRKGLPEIREALAESRQKLRELGTVNLMAPEEYSEVKERYDFLSSQLEDLQKARDDLKEITKEIRDESAQLFLDTYNRIKKNFHNMFRRLFGGGRGELRLVDPDHILESGIEIYAQPPGKKLENISLLSGGEKSLTAIGLLFATYLVRPSPFCFLDEIDAALDEQNVVRFVNLLREFGKTSQFIIITHNKKTVTGADALLGVTMEESGVTKVIAVRLERSEGSVSSSPVILADIEDEEVEYEHGRELGNEKEKPDKK